LRISFICFCFGFKKFWIISNFLVPFGPFCRCPGKGAGSIRNPYVSLNSSNFDGLVKSPSAALRFNFVVAAHLVSALHSSVFARLASGAFYETIVRVTFYEILNFSWFV
jgi:hypothetical protein